MKKDNVKFGIYFLLGWNLLVLLCLHLRYLFFDPDLYELLLGNPYDLWYTLGNLMLWSTIWFVIGYDVRKEYVLKRHQFRENFPHLADAIVDKYYRSSYLAKYTGILYKVALVSIPAYMLYRREFFDGDFVVVVLLALLSGVLFYVHRCSWRKSRL